VNRTESSFACARVITAAVGDGAPNTTHTVTYDPEPHVERAQSETRPADVFPSKSVWMADGTIRSPVEPLPPFEPATG
jgi:hypothetical protein